MLSLVTAKLLSLGLKTTVIGRTAYQLCKYFLLCRNKLLNCTILISTPTRGTPTSAFVLKKDKSYKIISLTRYFPINLMPLNPKNYKKSLSSNPLEKPQKRENCTFLQICFFLFPVNEMVFAENRGTTDERELKECCSKKQLIIYSLNITIWH